MEFASKLIVNKLCSLGSFLRKQPFHSSVGKPLCRKYTLDKSKVPTFNESDLKEKFGKGSGPGGQSVQTTSNKVILIHIPTGLIVSCHETRSVEENRKIARERLVTKLDNQINGENSIEAQKRRIDKKRSSAAASKRRKREELKRMWKEKETLSNESEEPKQ